MAEELLRSRHAFGNSADLFKALEEKKIDAFDLLMLDGDTAPKFGWVDKNNNVRIVDTECVLEVEELPDSGEVGKVYIFGDEGYFWNGTEFVNFCKPTDLTNVEERINELETALNEVKTTILAIEEVFTKHEEKSNVVFEKIKYEVDDVPTGTLVDYRENEIRIMCPYDAVFTKQAVGTGGDADSYYVTFKTYAPSEEAVGYIEHLGTQVDDKVLTDLKIDAYGRKYQPTWLGIAKYDNTTDTWSYYGSNSTTEKYIGWDYQIDWFNADGVMIASDKIRINLSNENCHSVIEPYYVSNMVEEAVGKSKAYTDEQLEAIIAKLAAVEIVEF